MRLDHRQHDKLRQRFISIELTKNCNNSCKHCYNFWRLNGRTRANSGDSILSREEILLFIKKVKQDIPLEYVALSGGEPLLRKDFPDIVGDIVDLDLQPVVITNGVLLTDSLLKRLPQGINFEITLFGHTAALHNRLAGNEVFDRVVENMARVNRFGSYVTLAFVATRLNALDVYRTVELGLALGAIAVMYNRVNFSRGIIPYVDDLAPPVGMLSESLNLLQEATRKYRVQSVCSVPIPPCVVDISKFPDVHFGWCPRGGDNAYYTIGTDGCLRPCNHSSTILGDLRSEGFAEIISSEQCNTFWQRVPEICRSCTHYLRDECMGGCRAAADEFYDSFDRADPICELTMNNV